jgi:predicted nucleotidyltransferase
MKTDTNLNDILPMMELASFCRRRGVRSLALFGSYLHGNTHPGSDIDLLVEYYPEQRIGLFAMAEMESELSHLLKRAVDLRTAQDLSVYFRDHVLAEAQVLYES